MTITFSADAAVDRAGLVHARKAVADGPDLIANAQEALRAAIDQERRAKEALDEALCATEWDLGAWFVTEANKQWLLAEPGGTDKVRSMTADEKKAWLANEGRKDREVRATTVAHREAEHAVAIARDGVVLADKRFRAALAELDAAIAQLNVLALSLGGSHRA